MRLIDADRLLNPGYTDMFDEPIKFDMISRNAIENAPTVKAIPVEWIENKIAVNIHLWEEGLDKMFIENGVVEITGYSLTAQTLSMLLEWWEKENETN